jgi:hypothetical protein
LCKKKTTSGTGDRISVWNSSFAIRAPIARLIRYVYRQLRTAFIAER